MMRKLLEIRVLMAIIALSKNPQAIRKVIFVNDSLFGAITDEEREKFTKIFLAYPGFKELYDAPRAPRHDVATLARLPENTLGFHYAAFMRKHGYVVDWYPQMAEKSPLHFARNRQYQTHDILHTITCFSGSPIDELALQGFYTAQAVPNPTAMMTFTAATLDKLRANDPDRNIELMDHIMEGYTMGRAAQRVIFRDWEKDLETDISELRASLGIKHHAECTAKS